MKAKRPVFLSRRTALQTLAIGAGSVAFPSVDRGLDLRLGGLAHAAAGGPPRRVVFVYIPNGVDETVGWETSWLKPGPSETDFTFGAYAKPFEAVKSHAVFFDNLTLGLLQGDTHISGQKMVLTANRLSNQSNEARPTSLSFDQHLAQKYGKIATPQWPSVELAVLPNRGGGGCSYLGDGSIVPNEGDPMKAYAKLFGSIPDAGKAIQDPKLLDRLMVRRSVLDSVAKDLADFQRRLPAEDRLRADTQLEAIRGMEQRLAEAAAGRGAGAGCQRPKVGTEGLDIRASKNTVALARMQYDVVAAALACDLTRVVTVTFAGAFHSARGDFDPVNKPNLDWHGISHLPVPEKRTPGNGFEMLKRTLHTELVAFLRRLEAIPEGSGTVLDNTVVVLTTEISAGHTHQRMPWATFGGANLGVRTGRFLNLPSAKVEGADYRGVGHAKLFVSLANALGLNDEYFGARLWGPGPLPGYRA